MSLKRITTTLLTTTLFLAILGSAHPAGAENTLAIKIDITNSYLNGFKPSKTATLGDEWTISVRVRDNEGDPAAGSEIRIYRGKKQIAFGRSNSKGISKIQLPITRLGSNSLRIVARDTNPNSVGEVSLDFDVLQPVMQTSVFSRPPNFFKDPQRALVEHFATNISSLMQTGCRRYWVVDANTWPFAEAEEIQKWGFTTLPRNDQSKIDSVLSDSYKGWALTPMSDDGTAPLLICDISGVLNLFNR
jgi:hypothetical protein